MTKPRYTTDPVSTGDPAVDEWLMRQFQRLDDYWPQDIQRRLEQLETSWPYLTGTWPIVDIAELQMITVSFRDSCAPRSGPYNILIAGGSRRFYATSSSPDEPLTWSTNGVGVTGNSPFIKGPNGTFIMFENFGFGQYQDNTTKYHNLDGSSVVDGQVLSGVFFNPGGGHYCADEDAWYVVGGTDGGGGQVLQKCWRSANNGTTWTEVGSWNATAMFNDASFEARDDDYWVCWSGRNSPGDVSGYFAISTDRGRNWTVTAATFDPAGEPTNIFGDGYLSYNPVDDTWHFFSKRSSGFSVHYAMKQDGPNLSPSGFGTTEPNVWPEFLVGPTSGVLYNIHAYNNFSVVQWYDRGGGDPPMYVSYDSGATYELLEDNQEGYYWTADSGPGVGTIFTSLKKAWQYTNGQLTEITEDIKTQTGRSSLETPLVVSVWQDTNWYPPECFQFGVLCHLSGGSSGEELFTSPIGSDFVWTQQPNAGSQRQAAGYGADYDSNGNLLGLEFASNGVARGIYWADGSTAWVQRTATVPIDANYSNIHFDPETQRFYAIGPGYFTSEVKTYWSDDAGVSWNFVSNQSYSGSAPLGGKMVARDPNYWVYQVANQNTTTYFFVSTNKGASWVQKTVDTSLVFPIYRPTVRQLGGFDFCDVNRRWFWSAKPSSGSGYGGILRSTGEDISGTGWQFTLEFHCGSDGEGIRCHNGYVLAASDAGSYWTRNNGDSWTNSTGSITSRRGKDSMSKGTQIGIAVGTKGRMEFFKEGVFNDQYDEMVAACSCNSFGTNMYWRNVTVIDKDSKKQQ